MNVSDPYQVLLFSVSLTSFDDQQQSKRSQAHLRGVLSEDSCFPHHKLRFELSISLNETLEFTRPAHLKQLANGRNIAKCVCSSALSAKRPTPYVNSPETKHPPSKHQFKTLGVESRPPANRIQCTKMSVKQTAKVAAQGP